MDKKYTIKDVAEGKVFVNVHNYEQTQKVANGAKECMEEKPRDLPRRKFEYPCSFGVKCGLWHWGCLDHIPVVEYDELVFDQPNKYTIEGFKNGEFAITFENDKERKEFADWCSDNWMRINGNSEHTLSCYNGVYVSGGLIVGMWMRLIGVPSVPYAEVFKGKEEKVRNTNERYFGGITIALPSGEKIMREEAVLDPETTAAILNPPKYDAKKHTPKEEILVIPQGNRTVAVHKVDGKTVCTAYTDKHPDDTYSLAEGAKWATKYLAEKEAKKSGNKKHKEQDKRIDWKTKARIYIFGLGFGEDE